LALLLVLDCFWGAGAAFCAEPSDFVEDEDEDCSRADCWAAAAATAAVNAESAAVPSEARVAVPCSVDLRLG
jgi:hypothetical protein